MAVLANTGRPPLGDKFSNILHGSSSRSALQSGKHVIQFRRVIESSRRNIDSTMDGRIANDIITLSTTPNRYFNQRTPPINNTTTQNEDDTSGDDEYVDGDIDLEGKYI